MSLVGKKVIPVPAAVEFSVDGNRNITVKGAKGTLTMVHRPEVVVVLDGDEKVIRVTVDESRKNDRQIRAYWGLTRSLIANMIDGVSKGYEKKLDIVGVGWQAQVKGQSLALSIGFANVIEIKIPMGVNVEAKGQNITINGADKQAVGNFASSVRMQRKPEPYNGKGIRYAGEQITRKQGKAFGN
ncbi:MAG: 50S ribosomal protein L6 [Planctomycetota bacterium]|jgi:large subunit ribosomal protein L6|nr:50S ribosomal protein L6 [Planctomycetota bacterium]MDA1026880.1 50S ribosomal protein L6 [Planctomycetota bacterium]